MVEGASHQRSRLLLRQAYRLWRSSKAGTLRPDRMSQPARPRDEMDHRMMREIFPRHMQTYGRRRRDETKPRLERRRLGCRSLRSTLPAAFRHWFDPIKIAARARIRELRTDAVRSTRPWGFPLLVRQRMRAAAAVMAVGRVGCSAGMNPTRLWCVLATRRQRMRTATVMMAVGHVGRNSAMRFGRAPDSGG